MDPLAGADHAGSNLDLEGPRGSRSRSPARWSSTSKRGRRSGETPPAGPPGSHGWSVDGGALLESQAPSFRPPTPTPRSCRPVTLPSATLLSVNSLLHRGKRSGKPWQAWPARDLASAITLAKAEITDEEKASHPVTRTKALPPRQGLRAPSGPGRGGAYHPGPAASLRRAARGTPRIGRGCSLAAGGQPRASAGRAVRRWSCRCARPGWRPRWGRSRGIGHRPLPARSARRSAASWSHFHGQGGGRAHGDPRVPGSG